MDDAHAKSGDEVLKYFSTGPDGLTEDQVERLRSKYGYNGISFKISQFIENHAFRNAHGGRQEALGAYSRTIR